MKYLLIALLFAFPVMAAPTENNQTTNSDASYTNSATFVTPLSVGGGDVLPSMGTVGYKSATCANNQFIFDVVYSDTSLSGNTGNAGSYGNAIRAGLAVPFGDDGNCRGRQRAIARDAGLISNHNEAINTHRFCKEASDDFKKRRIILDEEYYFEYPYMQKCQKLFELAGVSLIIYE